MGLQLDALVEGIERHYRHVEQTRMHDVPILNPRVKVEAVGFHAVADGYLGVLVTPWFINLMLLPREGDDWAELPVGSAQPHTFPSGRYDFLIASDEPIGRYQACSLLSPILEIDDHETAITIARESLVALMNPECSDAESSTHAGEIERLWRGEPADEDGEAQAAPDDANPEQPESQAEVSRRDFLRGRMRGTSESRE